MSNTQVGPVYDTIIAEVINAVRVDFEENGVDDGALEDLKKVRFFFLFLPVFLPLLLVSPLRLGAKRRGAAAYHPTLHRDQLDEFIRNSSWRASYFRQAIFRISKRSFFREFPWFNIGVHGQRARQASGGQPLSAACRRAPWGREGVESSGRLQVGDPALLGLFLRARPTAAGTASTSVRHFRLGCLTHITCETLKVESLAPPPPHTQPSISNCNPQLDKWPPPLTGWK